MSKTFYICDRKREICQGICSDECFHTLNTKHAVNGACKDPINHRDRFRAISVNGEIEFWERLNWRLKNEAGTEGAV